MKVKKHYEQDHAILYVTEGDLQTTITLESDRQMKRLADCLTDLYRTDGREVSIGEDDIKIDMTDQGIMTVYIGELKNLRGAQRRVGNVCKTPRGFHFYDGKHWQKMDVPESIDTKECLCQSAETPE